MALWVRVAGRRTSCTEDMAVFCGMYFTPGGLIGGQSAAGAASVMLTRGVWQCQVQRLLDLAIGLIFVFGVSAALASMFTELVSCCSTSMCSPSAVPYTANRREHGGKHSGGQRHWLSRQQETARVPGKAPSAVVGCGRGRPADWVGHRPRLPGAGSTLQLDGPARTLRPAWRRSFWQFVLVLIGFFLMIIAIVPGAQFWFGLLSKIGAIRSTGPKPAGAGS